MLLLVSQVNTLRPEQTFQIQFADSTFVDFIDISLKCNNTGTLV